VAAKTRLEFCALNDYRCKAHYSCSLCEDLWNAATRAVVEKFTSTNNSMTTCPKWGVGFSCYIDLHPQCGHSPCTIARLQ
jgi:hypothetical protein